MNDETRGRWPVLATLVILFAQNCGASCSSDGNGRDSGTDPGADAARDSGVDSGSDSGVDADSGSDTGTDVDLCAESVEVVPCEGAPRSESGMLDEEVCVPGGWFIMGRDDPAGGPMGQPRHRVELSAFFLDRYPVTVERFEACLDAGVCHRPKEWPVPCRPEGCVSGIDCTPCGDMDPHSPMLYVSKVLAAEFCAWDERGGVPGRLPTEAEYERAMVGLGCEGRLFPWGNEPPDCSRVCVTYYVPQEVEVPTCDIGNLCAVDGWPAGESPDGVAMLLGTASVPMLDCYWGGYYWEAEATGPDPVCGAESSVKECVWCESERDSYRPTRPFSYILIEGRSTFSRGRGDATGDEQGTGESGIRCARSDE